MSELWVHCEHGASGPVCVFNNVGCIGGRPATLADLRAVLEALTDDELYGLSAQVAWLVDVDAGPSVITGVEWVEPPQVFHPEAECVLVVKLPGRIEGVPNKETPNE